MSPIIKAQIKQLQQSILENTESIQETRVLTEHSLTTWTFRSYLLADAPLAVDGMLSFAVAFITDGRKAGEGVGAGTGVPAYYNPATDRWIAMRNNSVVAA